MQTQIQDPTERIIDFHEKRKRNMCSMTNWMYFWAVDRGMNILYGDYAKHCVNSIECVPVTHKR